MSLSGVLVLLVLLALGGLSATTLVVAVRGGRGPADPPASHVRVDLGGFPVPPAPRGVLPARSGPRTAGAHPATSRPRNGIVRGRRLRFRLRSASAVPMQR